MNIVRLQFGFRRTLISLAACAACAPAYAQDGDIEQLTRPESSVSVGVGTVSGDQRERSLLGQFNGWRDSEAFGQIDVDINKRDDATGTSMSLKARNLGLSSRDIFFSHERQGSWNYSLDYSELVRHDPRTVNTGMLGLGTASPTVVRLAAPGTGADFNFQMKRVGLGLAGGMWINPNLQLEISFKVEDKNGDRRYGKGYDCVAYICTTTQNATNQRWALLMLAEPVDSTTRQIEARLNYNGESLNLSAGYYGSFFNSGFGSLQATVPNILNNPLGVASTLNPAVAGSVIPGGGTSLRNVLQQPTALSPDNQAHQFYLSGNYRFTPSTKATFKYAYTHATQREDFAAMGLGNAPAGVTNLGGVLNTSLFQLGLTSRPLPKLSLLADLRYERKVDKTPDALYNVEGVPVVPATVPVTYENVFWRNYHIPTTKIVGKFEASYQLPADLRGTLGLDYKSLERFVPVRISEEELLNDELAGLGAMRAKNVETGYRLELRRSMSETLTGAVSYGNSRRRGSDWTSLNTSVAFANAGLAYGQTGSASQFIALSAGNAFPMSMADVDRDRIRLSANWSPSEQLDLQFAFEDGKDKNVTAFSPVALGKGWRESSQDLYSVDASYAVSDNWKLNGYVSQGRQNLKINHGTGYMADLTTHNDSFGFGVSGKPTGRLEVGAQLTYLNDSTRYGLRASPSVTGAAPSAANLAQVAIGLPDVTYRLNALNLFAHYELDKKASIRFNLVHQRAKLVEWSWSNEGVPFVYSDNTTVTMKQKQTVNFVGIAYIYKF